MEDILQYESFLNQSINKANIEFSNYITTYMESIYYDDPTYFKEAVGDSIFIKLKKFFAELIISLQNFGKHLINEIERVKREISIDKDLHTNYNKFKKMKEEGKKTVEIIDYWTLSRDYLKCIDELQTMTSLITKKSPFSGKIVNIRPNHTHLDTKAYNSLKDLEDDLTKFHEVVDKYDKILQEDCNRKVTKNIDEVLDFFDKEISGRSKIIRSLYDGISTFKRLQQECEALEEKKAILGVDVIPKHMGIIRKMTSKLAAFMGKWTTKILTGICVIMG